MRRISHKNVFLVAAAELLRSASPAAWFETGSPQPMTASAEQ
jgi:hypothetical protein